MLSMKDSSSNGSGSEPSLVVAAVTYMGSADRSGDECVIAGRSLGLGVPALLRLKGIAFNLRRVCDRRVKRRNLFPAAGSPAVSACWHCHFARFRLPEGVLTACIVQSMRSCDKSTRLHSTRANQIGRASCRERV